jgi:hypothetical protein
MVGKLLDKEKVFYHIRKNLKNRYSEEIYKVYGAKLKAQEF